MGADEKTWLWIFKRDLKHETSQQTKKHCYKKQLYNGQDRQNMREQEMEMKM